MKSPLVWAPLLLIFCAALSGCHSRSSAPVWNVPELVGQPIDTVKQKIGIPQGETALEGDVRQSVWQRDDATLTANWKTTSRRVKDWTLVSRDDDHAVREEEQSQLLIPGQLKENVPEYSLDWIEAGQRPLFYTGVRVVPAPKNHAVRLRLTGSTALVQISYEITGAQAKSDTFLTITPWEESFTVPDDAKISLSAALNKTIAAGPTNFKLEILADEKVIGTADSSGELAKCQAEL